MSKPVTVSIPHELGKAEARRRIEQGFGSVREQLAGGAANIKFKERWEQDSLHFEGGTWGQTIRGRVDVGDDLVLVEVVLPKLMAALAETVKGKLSRQGTQLLEKK